LNSLSTYVALKTQPGTDSVNYYYYYYYYYYYIRCL